MPDIVDALMCKESAMKVFTKDTLPIRHHYTNSERIGKVLLDMEDAWLVFRYIILCSIACQDKNTFVTC